MSLLTEINLVRTSVNNINILQQQVGATHAAADAIVAAAAHLRNAEDESVLADLHCYIPTSLNCSMVELEIALLSTEDSVVRLAITDVIQNVERIHGAL